MTQTTSTVGASIRRNSQRWDMTYEPEYEYYDTLAEFIAEERASIKEGMRYYDIATTEPEDGDDMPETAKVYRRALALLDGATRWSQLSDISTGMYDIEGERIRWTEEKGWIGDDN